MNKYLSVGDCLLSMPSEEAVFTVIRIIGEQETGYITDSYRIGEYSSSFFPGYVMDRFFGFIRITQQDYDTFANCFRENNKLLQSFVEDHLEAPRSEIRRGDFIYHNGFVDVILGTDEENYYFSIQSLSANGFDSLPIDDPGDMEEEGNCWPIKGFENGPRISKFLAKKANDKYREFFEKIKTLYLSISEKYSVDCNESGFVHPSCAQIEHPNIEHPSNGDSLPF